MTAENLANKDPFVNISSGISVHPKKPDFQNHWIHSKEWDGVDIDTPQNLAAIALNWVWSPCFWKNRHRLADNFLFSDWGALDIDGTYCLKQACQDWCDTKSVILTTKSDCPESRHFRIIFQWERRIKNVDEYVFNTDRLVEKYETDDQATDGARFFWPGIKIIQVVPEGLLQPVIDLPNGYTTIKMREIKALKKYRGLGASRVFPQNIKSWLRGIDVDNCRNNCCYKTGKFLTFWGMEDKEIINLVLKSQLPIRTYLSLKEAENAVKSGVKRAQKLQRESIE